MQPRESPEAAAARAVREELGARARARIHAEVVDGVPEDEELETQRAPVAAQHQVRNRSAFNRRGLTKHHVAELLHKLV